MKSRKIFLARLLVGELVVLSVLIAPAFAPAARPLSQPASTSRPANHLSSAAVPVQRKDPNSLIAHEQLVAKAKAGRIDVYFLGDSITRRWGCTDPQYAAMLENWKTNFYGWNAANFGWGADSIQNMLWRITNGELDGVNPKVIVILAGTNNVGNKPGDEQKVANLLAGFQALIATAQQKAPSAKIILTAIFPRNDNLQVLPEINQINSELAKLADDQTIFYLNVNDKLADKKGILLEGMSADKLHLTVQGYQVWADGLKPLLTRFLGPPAQTDHAPPPTGDPSLANRSGSK
jgi:lysophospholipase L1-like esterase